MVLHAGAIGGGGSCAWGPDGRRNKWTAEELRRAHCIDCVAGAASACQRRRSATQLLEQTFGKTRSRKFRGSTTTGLSMASTQLPTSPGRQLRRLLFARLAVGGQSALQGLDLKTLLCGDGLGGLGGLKAIAARDAEVIAGVTQPCGAPELPMMAGRKGLLDLCRTVACCSTDASGAEIRPNVGSGRPGVFLGQVWPKPNSDKHRPNMIGSCHVLPIAYSISRHWLETWFMAEA